MPERARIRAEAHSDDFAVEVEFNALQWFEQASQQDILALCECEWGGDYPADRVAEFMAEHDTMLESMFEHIFVYNESHKDHIGYECHVNSEDALRWLKDRMPDLALGMVVALPEYDQIRDELLDWYREHHPELVMETYCSPGINGTGG